MEISFHTPISISTNFWTKKRFLTKMFLATCIFFFKKQFVKIYFFGNKYLKTFYSMSSRKLKGALSGLRQYFVTESHLKIMKNAFFFINFKIYYVKSWLFASQQYTYWPISQAINTIRQRNFVTFSKYFSLKLIRNGGETITRPFSKKSKFSISLNHCYIAMYVLCIFLLFAKFRTIEIDWSEAADHLLLPYKNI